MTLKKSINIALLSTAALFFATASGAEARCTGFGQQAELVGDILDVVCTAVGDCPFGNQQAQAGLPKKLLDGWNDIQNNGPLTIGPRDLAPTVWDHGEVGPPPGKRLWIVPRGVDGEYTLKIKHKDGKSRMIADLCGVNKKGNVRFLGFVEVPNDSATVKTWTKTVSLDQESLFIDMVPKTAFRTFQYDIWVGRE